MLQAVGQILPGLDLSWYKGCRLLTCLQLPWQTGAMKIDCPIQEDPWFLHYLLFQKIPHTKPHYSADQTKEKTIAKGWRAIWRHWVKWEMENLSYPYLLCCGDNWGESQELRVPSLASPLSPQSLSPVRRRGRRGRALSHQSSPLAHLAMSIRVDWLFREMMKCFEVTKTYIPTASPFTVLSIAPFPQLRHHSTSHLFPPGDLRKIN